MSRQVSAATAAWLGLLRGHAATTRALSVELVASHGLTINDFEALVHIARAEGEAMRRIDLAKQLLLTASGVTRLLDGLERAGYVEKGTCSSDARVTYAVLTKAGRRKLEEASCDHFAAIGELFEQRFSAEELATLADLLGRLRDGDAAGDAACTELSERS